MKNIMVRKAILAAVILSLIAIPALPAEAKLSKTESLMFYGIGAVTSTNARTVMQLDLKDIRLSEASLIQSNSFLQNNIPLKNFGMNTEKVTTKNKVVREDVVHATGYSSTPDQTDDTPFITARGTYVRDGIVAANFLPFGTKIKIPDMFGDKIFVVEDRMAKRFSNRVDIWFPDRQSALNFGIRTVKIQILES